MKLTDSIHLVGSGSSGVGLTNPLDCNVYAIECETEILLIDAGSGLDAERIILQIDAANLHGKPVTRILLTHHHSDHAGGAYALRQHYRCQVLAPRDEADSIIRGDEKALGLDIARQSGYYPPDYRFTPCPVDHVLCPGAEFSVGNTKIRALDGAGHSAGGLCYYVQDGSGNMLFVGDLLAFGGLISLQNIPGCDIARYSKSVLALEDLPVDCFFPGHGCFSLSDGDAHIRKAAAAFRQLGIPKNAL